MQVTKVCGHGKGLRYQRSNLPVAVSCELKLTVGSLVSWEPLDEDSAILRVLSRKGVRA